MVSQICFSPVSSFIWFYKIVFIGSHKLTVVFLSRLHIPRTFITTYVRKLCFMVLLCYLIIYYIWLFDRMLQSFYFLLEFLSSKMVRNGPCLLWRISVSLSGILVQKGTVGTQTMNHHTTKILPAPPALSTQLVSQKTQKLKFYNR